jgi:hypothetical protein
MILQMSILDSAEKNAHSDPLVIIVFIKMGMILLFYVYDSIDQFLLKRLFQSTNPSFT